MSYDVNKPNNWLFQMAMLCLLLSYVSRDVLILRTVLLLANLFFILWGIIILQVAVDTVAWNTILLLLNAYQIYHLLKERVPIKFNEEMEFLYQSKFRSVYSRFLFNKFISAGTRRYIHYTQTDIMRQNEKFSTLFLVSRLYDNSVAYIKKDGELLGNLSEGSFFGKVEYVHHLQQKKLHRNGKCENLNGISVDVKTNDGAGVILYCWKIVDLDRLIKDKNHGQILLNGLQILLLNDLARNLRNLDDYHINTIRLCLNTDASISDEYEDAATEIN